MSISNWFQRTQQRQQTEREQAVATVRSCVETLASVGDLPDKAGVSLEQAVQIVGLPLTGEVSVANYAELLAEHEREKSLAATSPRVRNARDAAAEKSNAFRRETDSLIKDLSAKRNAQQEKLDKAVKELDQKADEAAKAEVTTVLVARKLRDYDRILAEGPPIIPAVIEGWQRTEKLINDRANNLIFVGNNPDPWRVARAEAASRIQQETAEASERPANCR